MSVEVRVETLNTETTTGKGSELADVMEWRNVDQLSVQVEGQQDQAFKLFYYDAGKKENVVREILKYVYTVLEMKRSSDRIRSLKLGDKMFFSQTKGWMSVMQNCGWSCKAW